MASVVADRVWRRSVPDEVENDLAEVWRGVGRDMQVARAVMSNLVVFKRLGPDEPSADALQTDATIEAIAARHPSRVLLIEHEPEARDRAATVVASVGVAVFGSPGARYAVEQIAVRSTCVELSLSSIVRRFIRGDLPTSIWWTEDLSDVPPVEGLFEIGRQLLYDSRRWRHVGRGISTIAPLLAERRIDPADLNWRRLAPFRQALLHVAPSLGADVAPSDVRMRHRPGDAALASLLVGWLAARLRWPAGSWPAIEETTEPEDETLSLTLNAESGAVTVSMNDHRVIVSAPNAVPLVVRVPSEEEADAVAAELRALSFDADLRDAVLALAQRANRI